MEARARFLQAVGALILVLLVAAAPVVAQAPRTYRVVIGGVDRTFDSLDDFKAFVAAYHDPIDAVYSEWALQASVLGACAPENTQPVTQTWARSILVPAQHGGVGGEPLSETREAVQACIYVAPAPTAHPLSIPWPAAGQAAWRTTLPMDAASAWARFLTCEGYPEDRFKVITQWHDSAERDLNAMRHIHDEVCVPRITRTPTVLFEQWATNFHWQGGTFESFRKVVLRGWAGAKILPAPVRETGPGEFRTRIPVGEDGHLVRTYGPTLVKMTDAPEATWRHVEFDIQAQRPDGAMAQARIEKLYWFSDPLNTGANPTSLLNTIAAEGWVGANFGYLKVVAWGMRQFDTDKVEDYPTLYITAHSDSAAARGATVRLQVFKNPDLHRHDVMQPDGSHGPDYGQVLLDTSFVMPVQMKTANAFKIPHPPMARGDRILIRISDMGNPDIGSGAQLLGWQLGKGTK